MKTIAITNQKGGCGKTTTAINLAACLGRKDKRVLLIDMDTQGHASLGLGMHCEGHAGLYDAFANQARLSDVIIPEVVTGVDIVPATTSLGAAEHILSGWLQEHELSIQLEELEGIYDYVILDCPPTLGLLFVNALLAADEVIVPIEMSIFAINGIERLRNTIRHLEEAHEVSIPILVLPTMVDTRTRLARSYLRKIWEEFPDEVLPLVVHHTVRLKEAAAEGKPIIEYDIRSPAAADYQRLAYELIRRDAMAEHFAEHTRSQQLEDNPYVESVMVS